MAIRFSVIASGPPSQAQGLVRHGALWPWRTACHMAVTDAAGQHWTQVFTLGRLHALACEKVVWLDSAINAAWPLFHYGSDGWVRVPQSVQARLAARIVAGAVVALRATALLLTLRP
jgi:hypothetical protein